MENNTFHVLLQNFFLKWMMGQKKVSPSTIQSYKDTFRILFIYLSEVHGVNPSSINIDLINADTIIKFLNYLEKDRKNSLKTVNNRLAAIKSFIDYMSYECPEYSNITKKIKRIPFRKCEKKEICYLTKEEIDSLLNSCEINTADGRRDYLMLIILYNSGMRVSEMISIRIRDIFFSDNGKCHLRVMGKGRKERVIPLWKSTTEYLANFINEHKIGDNDFLLSGRNVDHLTRSGVRYRIDCIAKRAIKNCPSLMRKSITPHVFRHSTAMSLLQSGIDISTIALWLGHESIETTHQYMVADLKLKEAALSKLHEPKQSGKNIRYQATGDILQFLNSL